MLGSHVGQIIKVSVNNRIRAQVWNWPLKPCNVIPSSHLGFRDDGTVLRRGLVQSGKRRGQEEGAGPDQASQRAAGDVVLFSLHHHRVHHVENVAGQPHCTMQGGERGSLIMQRQRSTSIGQEVKPKHIKMTWKKVKPQPT